MHLMMHKSWEYFDHMARATTNIVIWGSQACHFESIKNERIVLNWFFQRFKSKLCNFHYSNRHSLHQKYNRVCARIHMFIPSAKLMIQLLLRLLNSKFFLYKCLKFAELVMDKDLICNLIPSWIYFIVVLKELSMLFFSLLDTLDQIAEVALESLFICLCSNTFIHGTIFIFIINWSFCSFSSNV